jgi:hypothetical protein
MKDKQFTNLYDPVHQGYLKHKQKQYQDWHDERPYTDELFWDTLVHLGWRQDRKEQKLGDEVNLILQLVLECPDCGKAIRTVNTHNIGQDGATTVSSLFKAEEDLERHQSFYCESKVIPEDKQ